MADTAKVWTIREVLNWTGGYLQRAQIEQPRLEAELLLGKALGRTRVELYMDLDRPLEATELSAYRSLIRHRADRIPTAYLLGEKEFMSLAFKVNRSVLIPRPETEVLVEWAIRHLEEFAPEREERPLLVADVGTGSGNIAVTLAKRFANVQVTAIDLSPDALEVARQNAALHGVERRIEFLEGDLLGSVRDKRQGFDLIAANLPYIAAGDLPHLPREVLYEPIAALDGGKDGLALYRKLVPQVVELLAPRGVLLLELGSGQARAAGRLFSPESWEPVRVIPDYAGHDRVLIARRKSPPRRVLRPVMRAGRPGPDPVRT
ncbi:MAG: peptide chain release factor N(5)-glutamine methyltransferase [Firmicutes bacterium]|nr:peptide chain release factor N(5)-glutamine methyltransferase [Bacillota bacterium]